MSPVFDFLFGQYSGYATIDIVLEITGVLFGLMSVWYAKKIIFGCIPPEYFHLHICLFVI